MEQEKGQVTNTAPPAQLLTIHSHSQTWKEKSITRYTPLKAEIMRLNKSRKKKNMELKSTLRAKVRQIPTLPRLSEKHRQEHWGQL